MARNWFRHQRNASRDDAICELVDLFGPVAEVAYFRLLELHCDADDGIKIRREDIRKELRIRDEWNFDVDAWLRKASYLKLIRVTKRGGSSTNRVLIAARTWPVYNPEFETKESAAERKRRSRAAKVTVTDDESHSDKSVTSHGTDGTYLKDKEKALSTSLVDTSDGPAHKPESQTGVSHESENPETQPPPLTTAERRHHVHVAQHKPQPDICRFCRPKTNGSRNDLSSIGELASAIAKEHA